MPRWGKKQKSNLVPILAVNSEMSQRPRNTTQQQQAERAFHQETVKQKSSRHLSCEIFIATAFCNTVTGLVY